MADAAPTPAAEPTSTPASPAVAASPAIAADPTPTPTQASPSAAPESPKPAVAPDAKQDAKPSAEPPQALFSLPDDLKLDDGSKTKFEGFLRSKLTSDGKVLLTSQEVMDQFAEQARDAYSRWQQQIADTDKANAAECQRRFTPAQIAESETAVGFISSYEPAYRDFAKSQLNNPVFVNAMRLIGERLSEDTFERGSAAPPPPATKSRAERMGYGKPKPN